MSWADAQKSCVSKGGSLARIMNKEQNAFVLKNIGSGNWWFGLNDLNKEKTWVYGKDKEEPSEISICLVFLYIGDGLCFYTRFSFEMRRVQVEHFDV